MFASRRVKSRRYIQSVSKTPRTDRAMDEHPKKLVDHSMQKLSQLYE